jgi:TonB family protein
MKKSFVLLLLFIALVNLAFAQQKGSKIIQKDTINIYGKIITENGSKIGYTTITSTSLDNTYQRYLIGTVCDSLGNFKLEGIKSLDTLTINHAGKTHTVVNQASRHLTITLPSQVISIDVKDKPSITAKRIIEKPKLKFEVDTSINFYCGTISLPATYPGGMAKFIKFISSNLVYPIAAIKNNIEGTIRIEFKIAKDGTLISPKTINGLGYGCDEVVLDIIMKSKKWNPGISNGKPVITTFQTDVTFKLQD